MTNDVERCQRCQQLIRPGATFCTACGAPLSNRAAHSLRNIDHAQKTLMGPAVAHGNQIPGNIPVGPADAGVPETGSAVTARDGLSRGNGQVGGTGMAATLELVPAGPGKRLGAAVLDWLAPLVVLAVMLAIGFASITRTQSGGFITYDTSMLVLLGSIAIGLTLVYTFVLMGLEGRSGNTIGNQLMGIRSADKDGDAPGVGAVFVRGIMTGAGVLLAVIAAVLVVALKRFDLALWILGPLAFLASAWALIVVLSNSWDRNGGLKGWHDSAAKTLVFDVQAGRNPVTTGGIRGPYSFAPLELPPVQQVSSPVAGANRTPELINAQAPPVQSPTVPAVEQPLHPDDDHDRTQMRGGVRNSAAVAVPRIRLDDGREFRLEKTVLIGRNPTGQAGEQQAQLLGVVDPGRTISKTHLHILTDGAGIWVTDRNSTNGSAVTTPDGVRTVLQAGVPTPVNPGSTVHFGDRNFQVGQA